jgi:uncharacterized integral membrane protein
VHVRAKSAVARWYHIGRGIAAIVLLVIAVVFIAANWNDVSLDYLADETDLPLAAVMLLFLAIGMGLGYLFHWFSGRARRRS